MPNPADLSCRCPRCGLELWALRKGQWTLKNRVLKLADDGGLVAKCGDCSAEIPVNFLRLTDVTPPVAPPAVPSVRVRMVVRVDKPQPA